MWKAELRKVKDKVRGIDPESSLLDIEGEYLYELAKKNVVGPIVEIGSWKGRSTIWLAHACIDKLKEEDKSYTVYAIDPHKDTATHKYKCEEDTYNTFLSNIGAAEVDKIVRPVRMKSKEAVKEVLREQEVGQTGLGLVFIDGDHSYEAVKFDFYAWAKVLNVGGVVVLHDVIESEGPRRVAYEDIFNNREFRVVGIVGQLVAGKKVRPSNYNTLWNWGWLIYWNVYGWFDLPPENSYIMT